MSTVTTENRTSVEGFYSALARRLSYKGFDRDCAVLAEELLEEVRALPENRKTYSFWTVMAGEQAMEFLNDQVWGNLEKNEAKNKSFPMTRGILFEAVLNGWEETYNLYGARKEVQTRFARFIAGAIKEWDSKERAAALLKIREKLKEINPPVGWELVCYFLSLVESEDDEEVLHAIGRSFGHLANWENLALAAKKVIQANKSIFFR